MGPGGNFRNDAAIFFENVYLRDNNVTEDFLTILDNRSSGFITRRLNGKNIHNSIYYNILTEELQGINGVFAGGFDGGEEAKERANNEGSIGDSKEDFPADVGSERGDSTDEEGKDVAQSQADNAAEQA